MRRQRRGLTNLSPLVIISAFFLDLLLGDPRPFPHPVRAFGKSISLLEGFLLRPGRRREFDRATGVLLVLFITLSVFFGSLFLLILAERFLGDIVLAGLTVYLAYTTISVKGLADAAREVLTPLKQGDITAARERLSMVVGRDTAGLDEDEISRATVETVAENTSDGVVAPLLYLALGGVPLALTYKAINTMDSMMGYKSERYKDFGWAAARLDDMANFIPARLTGVLMVAGAYILSFMKFGPVYSGKDSWRVLIRDGKNHPSPNSGYPEAAAAGALQVRLGGTNSYFGVVSVKPFIGDPVEPLTAGKISDAVRLMYATAVLTLGVAVVLSKALSSI